MSKKRRVVMDLKTLRKRVAQRPTIWKHNDYAYIMASSQDGKDGWKIIQKSNGMNLAIDVWTIGWNRSLGYHHSNSEQVYLNKKQDKFKLIGIK
jgi:hypothetical protein